jgi:radical SAM superfamily enzyme YgiQ (UPF0313 family)
LRVLFLEIDTEREWAVASLGPGFIAAYLRRHGHDALLLRATVDLSDEQAIAAVRSATPDLLGVSLTTRQWLRARTLLRAIRQAVDVPVIAGGLHATFAPEAVLGEPTIDYVCLGEGEGATLDLVRALAQGGSTDTIANLWAKGAARPAVRPPYEPLDDLPFVARDMLDEHDGCVHMTTQRGCPFKCSYCGARLYQDLYEGVGEYGRRRSHESVVAELEAIGLAGGLNYVIFLDDTFTVHRPWVKRFCQIYGERIGVPFSIHSRVETVNRDMLAQLATAGCRHVTYGVESGSYRIRKHVMLRPVRNDRIKQVFRWTREAGMTVTANYMLGLPNETPRDVEQTLALAEELEADDFGYFVFYPYPGTRLFDYCRERGYLPSNHLELPANHRESILRLPSLSQQEITEYYDRFTALRARRFADRARASSGGDPSHEFLRATTSHVHLSADAG